MSEEFEQLDPNIFVDAMLRKEHNNSYCRLVDIMHKDELLKEYTLAFEGETNESVPRDIIVNYLIPYMRDELSPFSRKKHPDGKLYKHRALYMQSGPRGMFVGAMLTVESDGSIVRVENWGKGSECPEWLLNIWPTVPKTKQMVDLFDEYSPGSCASVKDNLSKEEMERRFWITVFGKVFGCCWWHYKGYKWLS